MRRRALPFPLDRTGRLARSGRQDVFVGLRKRLRWQGVVLGLRFVEIRACRPEVCRSFDQGQQRVRCMVHLLICTVLVYAELVCYCVR